MKLIYTLFTLFFLLLFSLSNSGGRAGASNQGNTGAPGDETLSNGTARTCQSCHATGDIQLTMTLAILGADNNPITAYIPNEIYTAKVNIKHESGPMPAGYGFQMVSLFDEDNSDVNGWTMEGHSENVQIESSTLTNRVYAEHKGTSESNEFLVKWQAPEAGKGAISFYTAGNGVNENDARSGDGAAIPQKLTLIEEKEVSSIKELSSLGIDFLIAPNPIKEQLRLSIESPSPEELSIKVLNATGQVFYEKIAKVITGKNQISLPINDLAMGIYWLQIAHKKAVSTQKIIKL